MMRAAFCLVIVLLNPGAASGQISDDVVRIGQMEDLSQPATGPGALIAAQMAIEDHGGKVLGKPVEYVSVDHQSKPDVAVALARQWYDRDRVDVIVGTSHSAISAAIGKLAVDRNRLLLANAANADLTGKDCLPNSAQWHTDTISLARLAVEPVIKQGKRKFFFLTVDYAFGHAMEREATNIIKANGGTVVGSVRHPFGASDYASYLIQAQASGAEVLAFATSGSDFQNAVKQAAEFGLKQQGMTLLGLNPHITDIHGLGLSFAQGLLAADAWNWSIDEPSRQFARRFFARAKVMPTALVTATYSAVTHYLKAVERVGTDDARAVMKSMRDTPVDDFYAQGGRLRPDGRMVHRWLYLFKVKAPAESKEPWDYYETIARVAGEDLFRPLDQGGCKFAQ